MLLKILVAVAAVVVAFLTVVAVQPAEFRITRTATVSAPPGALFAQVNDFHNWEAWSPWARLDPAMRQSFDGASAGVGAAYTWVGNKRVGAGRMTVVESRAGELVRIRLEFVEPFRATSTAEFTFRPVGDQTAVTWTMTGRKNFVTKAIHLFLSMDAMVGGSFETGLAQMKSVAEAAQSSHPRRGRG